MLIINEIDNNDVVIEDFRKGKKEDYITEINGDKKNKKTEQLFD